MVLKVIHVADLHLGASFKYLSGRGVEELRRLDFVNNLNKVVLEALRRGVNLFIIAGDVFHRPEPSARDFMFFTQALGKLISNGVKVIIIAGNHDKPRSSKSKTLLEGLQALGLPNFYYVQNVPDKPLIIDVAGHKVGVVALPYVDPRLVKELNKPYSNYIKMKIGELKDNNALKSCDFQILIAHLMIDKAKYVDVFPYFKDEPKVSLSDIYESYFDYVGLGHIHTPQGVSKNVYYAGSIERLNFAERNEEKSFIYLSLSKGEGLYVEKIPLDCRPMLELKIDLKGSSDPLGVFLSLLKRESFMKNSLVKIRLIGERELLKVIKSNLSKVEEILELKSIAGYYLDFQPIDVPLTISNVEPKVGVREEFEEFVKDFLKGKSEILVKEVISKGLKLLHEEGIL